MIFTRQAVDRVAEELMPLKAAGFRAALDALGQLYATGVDHRATAAAMLSALCEPFVFGISDSLALVGFEAEGEEVILQPADAGENALVGPWTRDQLLEALGALVLAGAGKSYLSEDFPEWSKLALHCVAGEVRQVSLHARLADHLGGCAAMWLYGPLLSDDEREGASVVAYPLKVLLDFGRAAHQASRAPVREATPAAGPESFMSNGARPVVPSLTADPLPAGELAH